MGLKFEYVMHCEKLQRSRKNAAKLRILTVGQGQLSESLLSRPLWRPFLFVLRHRLATPGLVRHGRRRRRRCCCIFLPPSS